MTDAAPQKTPYLRCQDCGERVYLDEDCNPCECGGVWRRVWQFEADAKIELWTFESVGKPARRRNNGR